MTPVDNEAFKAAHASPSVRKFARELGVDLSKVKGTTTETFIVANGFSCREQIEDLGRRETLHLADVLARTLA